MSDFPEYKAGGVMTADGVFLSAAKDVIFAGLIVHANGSGALTARAYAGADATAPALMEKTADAANKIATEVLPVPIRTGGVYVDFVTGGGKVQVVYA